MNITDKAKEVHQEALNRYLTPGNIYSAEYVYYGFTQHVIDIINERLENDPEYLDES